MNRAKNHGEMRAYAHSVEGTQDASLWEPLPEHLLRVAELAERFGVAFRAGHWGRATGLLHDLGKYSDKFQNYLLTANGLDAHLEQHSKVNHSTAGAKRANELFQGWGLLLAYIIAGHHAGLANANSSRSSLEERLTEEIPPLPPIPDEFWSPTVTLGQPTLTLNLQDPAYRSFQIAFFTRMVFSCLVDADFLATEEFMKPEQAAQRPTERNMLPVMQEALNRHLVHKSGGAKPGIVTTCRQEILSACRAAAAVSPGVFSLTVPTGGGKTLSSLAFALDHAAAHQLRRVIYAIPFTSIIEQTADVFRQVFENLEHDVVLEHHSNLDPERSSVDADNESRQSRLATENWDAPLIVTTNVQFFESLFAAKTSRCRKLHRIANSVIILDEAQTLPVDRLRACLAALSELVENYGCTIVLCTATQPAIVRSEGFPIGLQHVREIIPNPKHLSQVMRRVQIQSLGRLSDQELVEQLVPHKSSLTIVNTRGQAAKLYRELVQSLDSDIGVFHLSTLMCGQHRVDTLAKIRRRLKEERPCRVISTQLIEAGVDVDFPVVFRALSGLDSIAQAAGRCNREGRHETGTVYVFEPADVHLRGFLASTAQSAREVIPACEDLLGPEAIRKYFELHYWKHKGDGTTGSQWDKPGDQAVMTCFRQGKGASFDFRDAAERFQMIDNNGVTVFVPYGKKGEHLLKKLRKHGPEPNLMRKLQRYSVTLFENLYRLMIRDMEVISDKSGRQQFPIISSPGSYDAKLGVRIDRPGYIEPSLMIT